MVCLYPGVRERDVGSESPRYFLKRLFLSHCNFGGSDRAAALPGAISLKLNLQG